ncbi:phosphotransferase enzyme family-domain-containing protein [Podospora didyma]|uniref:Phosphotransferase enzyme family-domain-containing protein n=1 Tax=Podospora didyma TaxID=330526 RepID=A0AAE0U559_9PEZI|nr:phosphotransferase enzyme family-domain-containing protein [Podospora didyma]
MRSDASRDGLIWDDSGGGLDGVGEPRWTREPDIQQINKICRRHLRIPEEGAADNDCAVYFHTAGAYSKLYLVDTLRGRYMMRVSLPVDPHNKTRGEVTTLQLVRRKTDIPVPAVIAFDDTSKNEIGFEWILMDLMPGKPAYYRWRRMPMGQKEILTARVADFQAQLFRCGNLTEGFRSIGTLGASSEDVQHDPTSSTPEPGQIVSPVFFSGSHYHYTVQRGPFKSSHDWLRAYLNIIIKEHTTVLASNSGTDDDREYAEGVLRVARKLLRLLHKIFPAFVHPPERTVLWHDNLSLRNILVDDSGRITGVVDWQCLSTVPRWVASQMPEFLRGAARDKMPDRNRYTDVGNEAHGGSDGSDGASSYGPGLEDSLDNEGKTELYWIHLMEYEQTQLRKVYAARMRQRRPDWDNEVVDGTLKADFFGAVSRCGAGFYLRRIEQWVDALDRKEFLGLMEVLRVGIRKEKSGTSGGGARAGAVATAVSSTVSSAVV